jgi:U3 small nucleolar RNA-associated protein 15
MDFQPLQALPSAPRASSSTNPHSRHFHSFRHPLFIKHAAPVTHIHFSPSKPHRYAATATTRVIVYAPKTGKPVKTVTRFKDVARCGEFRKDGKLMVAGSDDGLVQIFDINSRAVLRTMKEHNQWVYLEARLMPGRCTSRTSPRTSPRCCRARTTGQSRCGT